VAGTGGRHLRPFVATDPTSEARDASTFGVLFLTLRPSGYDWRFSPAVGTFTDAGSSDCHA
jgi:acid phosphatase type 7